MANRPLYGILVCILLHSICSPIASQAQPAGEQPIQSMVVENALRSQYLGARLDLQRHFLKQLQDLQANGHAAWLEVRRQQLVVDQIAAQISALDQYKIFILDVAKTVTNEVLSSKRTLADPAPLMIYSNDSIRLIGWVEPDSSGLGSLATASRGPLDRFAIELPSNEPQHKQEQTQRRYQRALEEGHLPPHWLEQLRLESEVASAHWNLAQQQRETKTTRTNYSLPANLEVRKDWLTLRGSADLSEKTAQLIRAEAQAKNLSRFHESNLIGAQESVEILKELFQRGLITQQVWQASQQRRQQAQATAIVESSRLQRLQESLEQFESQATLSSEAKPPIAKGAPVWPASVFEDAFQLQHLLNLRKQRFILVGQSESARLELIMKRAWFEKLQQTLVASQTGEDSFLDPQDLGHGPFRERQKMAREIEKIQRFGEHLREQQMLVGLEEQRFISQCQELDALTAERETATAGTQGSRSLARPTRLSYFEVLPTQSETSMRGIWSGVTLRSPMNFQKPPERGSFWAFRNVASTHQGIRQRESRFGISKGDKEALVGFSHYGEAYRQMVSDRPANRLPRESSSSVNAYQYYQYGALKISSRRAAKVGQLPWYLPGSPGNYRGRW